MLPHDVNFRALFEASPEVLLVLLPDSPRFTMIAATETRLSVTHTTRDQTIGRGLFEIFPDNPDDPAATGATNLRASLDRVLATRAADTMAVQKYDIRGPDGTFEVRYWSPRNIPVLSETGDVQYILHRVEDVTELVRASAVGEELRGRTQEMEREVVKRSQELAAANNDLRALNARLGELDAAKTAFFSNISHEFRTPLTLMLGPLEEGLSDPRDGLGPVNRRRLELAHGNALRVLKLVNALLDFSRLEAGRMRAHFAPIEIGPFTAELAGMFQSAVEKAGLTFVVDCPAVLELVWVDRDMWEKIVTNLVSNAFKFTFEGEIAVRLRETAAEVVVSVSDTGVGIPEVELPQIFERFHRVAGMAGRTHEGTGIGLSLARELVEIHGGSLLVESEPGRGTTFRIKLPKGFAHLPVDQVSQIPADPHAPRDARAHATEAERWSRENLENLANPANPENLANPENPENLENRSRTRVLVVDDNADLREYVSGLLAPFYEVVTAADGVAALDLVRSNPPDIVVSDVMMPRLDGVGLVRALRGEPGLSQIPVILLSARAGETSAVEGLDAGADDYLAKPFSARELVARVRTHVELARTRRRWALELEETNKELEAFSYSVSHDLRAPLRHVMGFARLLKEHLADTKTTDTQAAHFADVMSTAAERMDRLIDDLLKFSRVGRAQLTRRDVPFEDLVHKVKDELIAHAVNGSRNIEWRIGSLPAVSGDPALLRQVVVNLLSNAMKYAAPRTRPAIEVGTLAGGGDEIVVFVRDNGVGFDAANARNLFGVFQRFHREDEFEGTGIGLANVRRIVVRHGGRVWAESRPDEGATFFVALPRSGKDLSPHTP